MDHNLWSIKPFKVGRLFAMVISSELFHSNHTLRPRKKHPTSISLRYQRLSCNLKDQNLKSLHKDLRHSNVKRYELAPKRDVDIKGSDR